jgi:hypothetical protein
MSVFQPDPESGGAHRERAALAFPPSIPAILNLGQCSFHLPTSLVASQSGQTKPTQVRL